MVAANSYQGLLPRFVLPWLSEHTAIPIPSSWWSTWSRTGQKFVWLLISPDLDLLYYGTSSLLI
jgi:hypothetical protein